MILELHPTNKKITIEIPDEFVDKDVEVIIKRKKKSLRGALKIKETKDESDAWLKWVKANNDKSRY